MKRIEVVFILSNHNKIFSKMMQRFIKLEQTVQGHIYRVCSLRWDSSRVVRCYNTFKYSFSVYICNNIVDICVNVQKRGREMDVSIRDTHDPEKSLTEKLQDLISMINYSHRPQNFTQ